MLPVIRLLRWGEFSPALNGTHQSATELSQTPEPRNEPADSPSPDAKFKTIGSLEIFLLVDSLTSDAQRLCFVKTSSA